MHTWYWSQVWRNPYLHGEQMSVACIRRTNWIHPKPIKIIYEDGYDNTYIELLLNLAKHSELKCDESK